MARIPTLEDTLLEVNQAFGLERPQTKPLEKYLSFDFPLEEQRAKTETFLTSFFSALELDQQAQDDARRNDLLGFFEPFIPVRRPGWEWFEWMDCAA